MKKYDYDTCPVCLGKNKIDAKSLDGCTVLECETECESCNHADYFAFGYYQSLGIVS